jgi:hypothetical protein
MLVKVFDIEWNTETDNCDVPDGYNESLPTEVIVEIDYPCDDDDIYSEAMNLASDKVEWLIEGCGVEVISKQ